MTSTHTECIRVDSVGHLDLQGGGAEQHPQTLVLASPWGHQLFSFLASVGGAIADLDTKNIPVQHSLDRFVKQAAGAGLRQAIVALDTKLCWACWHSYPISTSAEAQPRLSVAVSSQLVAASRQQPLCWCSSGRRLALRLPLASACSKQQPGRVLTHTVRRTGHPAAQCLTAIATHQPTSAPCYTLAQACACWALSGARPVALPAGAAAGGAQEFKQQQKQSHIQGHTQQHQEERLYSQDQRASNSGEVPPSPVVGARLNTQRQTGGSTCTLEQQQ